MVIQKLRIAIQRLQVAIQRPQDAIQTLQVAIYYANQKKRRTSKIDDKTFPRNEKQKN